MKRILLCCNAGMSTSLLVQKMQKEAATRSLEVEIEAFALNEIMEQLENTSIVLLGPQISYAKAELEQACAPYNVPVAVIAMIDYGRMNASKILDDALALEEQA